MLSQIKIYRFNFMELDIIAVSIAIRDLTDITDNNNNNKITCYRVIYIIRGIM